MVSLLGIVSMVWGTYLLFGYLDPRAWANFSYLLSGSKLRSTGGISKPLPSQSPTLPAAAQSPSKQGPNKLQIFLNPASCGPYLGMGGVWLGVVFGSLSRGFCVSLWPMESLTWVGARWVRS